MCYRGSTPVDRARPDRRGTGSRSQPFANLGEPGEMFGTVASPTPRLAWRVGMPGDAGICVSAVRLCVLGRNGLEASWLGGLHPLTLAGASVTDPL